MGTSTRRVFKRANKIIEDSLEAGMLSKSGDGSGLSELMAEFIYAEKGQTKIKKELNRVFASAGYYSSISKIVKLITGINKNGKSSIGIDNFLGYTEFQQLDLLVDYIGIGSDGWLKQSFKDTFEDYDFLNDNGCNPVDFIIRYIQNILKNIVEAFTFENASQNIDDFNDEKIDSEYRDYIVTNTQSALSIHIDNDFIAKIDEEEITNKALNRAYIAALGSLKG